MIVAAPVVAAALVGICLRRDAPLKQRSAAAVVTASLVGILLSNNALAASVWGDSQEATYVVGIVAAARCCGCCTLDTAQKRDKKNRGAVVFNGLVC